ncbi:MAG: helix-turn-helix domain-containing protein [Bacteroidales bacterium]|nr:helix-turn-helix domain-containing protein [Bacteroidales bacterium]MCL2738858.1 helix-turn-helix domain-containing protein [Bacteroidales bacterium]
MNKLIIREYTGSPHELARRLSISRSTLYEIIDELNSRGVEIKYSRNRGTFYYNNDMFLDIRFAIKPLESIDEPKELKHFSGGCNIFSSVLFLGRSSRIFVSESSFCSAQCKIC